MLSQIEVARKICSFYHREQDYGGKSYLYHLEEVVNLLDSYGFPMEYKIIGMLHDILEDTSCPQRLIEESFGADILESVKLISSSPLKSLSRLEKLKRVSMSVSYSPLRSEALAVKLCDRIVNTEFSQSNSRSIYRRYVSEYPYFERMLRNPEASFGGHPTPLKYDLSPLWDRLMEASRV